MRTADENERAKIVYDMAHIELPSRAQSDMGVLRTQFEEAPRVAAIRYYIRAAKDGGGKANPADMSQLRVHTGRLDDRRDVLVVEYPRFPAIDFTPDLFHGLPPALVGYVFAPYFSAIAYVRDSEEATCFVLGQDIAARTALTIITPTMTRDLGRACEPDLKAFLELVRLHSRTTWVDDDE